MWLVNAEQMKRIDERTSSLLNVPGTELMERAGRALAAHVGAYKGMRVSVLAKGGKNGGDGFVCARYLHNAGAEVTVYLILPTRIHPDTETMRAKYEECGGITAKVCGACPEIETAVSDADVVVDAMLGTGISRSVSEDDARVIEIINSRAKRVVSCDIPSGLSPDTGMPFGAAVRADETVAFIMRKYGEALSCGRSYSGKLICDTLGAGDVLYRIANEEGINVFAGCSEMLKAQLPERKQETHKGNYGKVLIIAGSRGYTGAAALAAMGSVRSGAGVTFCCVPDSVYVPVASKLWSPVVVPLPSDEAGRLSRDAMPEIKRRLASCDSVLIGPGLSLFPALPSMIAEILAESRVPIVLDADGINAAAENIDILKRAACPVVMTPHGGEFSRLCGGKVTSDYIADAKRFASEYGVTLLHKGHVTATASPDGRLCLNTTGNAGMARGGSGDILAGIIASFLAQGMEPFFAASAGAYVHGRAGDIAAERMGQQGMAPEDMLETLPAAFL